MRRRASLFSSGLRACTLAVSLGLALVNIGSAFADGPNGTWRRSATGALIEVFECGGGLGMKVVASPDPARIGKTILCGAVKTGPNKWKGTILNLDNNKRYAGYLTVNGENMALSGCVLGGVICTSETWQRQK